MEEEIKFKCEVCGEEFDPDPDTILETHLSADLEGIDESELERMEKEGMPILTEEDIQTMGEQELQEQWGLDKEKIERLLRGEDVVTGAMCVCKKCQDQAEATEEGAA